MTGNKGLYILKGNPKSTQKIYRYACRGNHPCMYMTAEGKEIKEVYQWELKAQKAKLLTGNLQVKVNLYFDDKRKRDIDNHNKLWMDAGTGILWTDDEQIQDLRITKNYDKNNPRIELFVEKLV
jgi:crossover junction endodeoxyribonuclease RusA